MNQNESNPELSRNSPPRARFSVGTAGSRVARRCSEDRWSSSIKNKWNRIHGQPPWVSCGASQSRTAQSSAVRWTRGTPALTTFQGWSWEAQRFRTRTSSRSSSTSEWQCEKQALAHANRQHQGRGERTRLDPLVCSRWPLSLLTVLAGSSRVIPPHPASVTVVVFDACASTLHSSPRQKRSAHRGTRSSPAT
jgi:hypothetical protein